MSLVNFTTTIVFTKNCVSSCADYNRWNTLISTIFPSQSILPPTSRYWIISGNNKVWLYPSQLQLFILKFTYVLTLKGRKKKFCLWLRIVNECWPTCQAQVEWLPNIFLTLSTQLLIQSFSKVELCIWKSYSWFLDWEPSGDQFPYFSSWAEGFICISKPMFRIGLRLECPKESPLTWAVTFHRPRNKKKGRFYTGLFFLTSRARWHWKNQFTLMVINL